MNKSLYQQALALGYAPLLAAAISRASGDAKTLPRIDPALIGRAVTLVSGGSAQPAQIQPDTTLIITDVRADYALSDTTLVDHPGKVSVKARNVQEGPYWLGDATELLPLPGLVAQGYMVPLLKPLIIPAKETVQIDVDCDTLVSVSNNTVYFTLRGVWLKKD